MAMKPLRPCRHPGCAALTREGYCPRHKPKPAARRVSAAYHSWYSLPVWTDDLRPAQLLAEPWCRDCARRGIRTRATVVDHVQPHRGDWDMPDVEGGDERMASLNYVPLSKWVELSVNRNSTNGGETQ